MDSSAVLSLFPGYGDGQVLDVIGQADDVVVSALCRSEVAVALGGGVGDSRSADRVAEQLGQLWEAFWVVPVDDRCLDLATDLATSYRMPLVPAIQLAAFDRVERPLRFVTLDGRQLPAAIDMGLDAIEIDVARSAHEMLRY